MFEKWFEGSMAESGMVLLTSAGVYVAILLYTRVVGLRSLSKMSAADFVMTVAVGSLFATTISTPSPTLPIGLVAIGSLYAGQWLIAKGRFRSASVRGVVDNQPLLLMADGEFLDANLKRCSVTRSDVYSKLRECNALSLSRVHAVVMEPTGDVSVLHGDPDAAVSSELLADVIDGGRVAACGGGAN